MSLRLGTSRYSSRLLATSLRQHSSRISSYCVRCLSISAQEQPSKPSIIPAPSTHSHPSPSSLQDAKRPEKFNPPQSPDPSLASLASAMAPSDQPLQQSSPIVQTLNTTSSSSPQPSTTTKPQPKFAFKPLKAALVLTPNAVSRLKEIVDQPEPKLVRVGVKNRGCAGLAYHLDYVDKPGKFDEIVEQDGVKVLIDSRALFSIIGSKMDFVEDRLSAKFVFENPHVKGSCGCGESFSVG